MRVGDRERLSLRLRLRIRATIRKTASKLRTRLNKTVRVIKVTVLVNERERVKNMKQVDFCKSKNNN